MLRPVVRSARPHGEVGTDGKWRGNAVRRAWLRNWATAPQVAAPTALAYEYVPVFAPADVTVAQV